MYFLVFFVFFFKQKTAYEMRISDWSSDVCSSDLWKSPDGSRASYPVLRQRASTAGPRRARLDLPRASVAQRFVPPEGFRDPPMRRLALTQQQIGRASCRERVCQYV